MKKFLKIIAIVILSFLVLSIILFKPVSKNVDIGSLKQETLQGIRQNVFIGDTTAPILAGWASMNITPSFKVELAGYGPRPNFEMVKDSIYVKCIVFSSGGKSFALLNYDLLFISPLLKKYIILELQNAGIHIDGVFFTVTHSHHSIGGWENSIVGNLILGGENEKVMDLLGKKTVQAVKRAISHMSITETGYKQIGLKHLVYNKMHKENAIDTHLRVLLLKNQHNEKAVFTSFVAHSTTVKGKEQIITGDYPSVLNKKIIQGTDADFAMYAAGTVGGCKPVIETPDGKNILRYNNYNGVYQYADSIYNAVRPIIDEFSVSQSQYLRFGAFPLAIGAPKMRINQKIQLREFIFEAFFDELDGEITSLRIGDIVFIGTPCDYSAEFYTEFQKSCSENSLHLFITSFNGGYIGYIMPDKYYFNTNKDEVLVMNWVGNGYDSYFTDIINNILDKI